jgi:Rrf2 family protein
MTASGRGTARIPARFEYAVRALHALATAVPGTVSAHTLAQDQRIPLGYLYDVLADLRRADLVYARRGAVGGYALAVPADQIRLGDLVRLLDAAGPTAGLTRPTGGDELSLRLGRIWLAAEQATRRIFDEVTIADLLTPTG